MAASNRSAAINHILRGALRYHYSFRLKQPSIVAARQHDMRNVFSCGLLIMLVGYRADFELVRQPYTNLTGSLSKASKSACGRSSSMSGRANTREERAFYYTTSRARVRTIGYTTRVRRYPHSISPTSFSWGS